MTIILVVNVFTGLQIAKSFGSTDYQPLNFSPGSEFLVTQ